MKNTTNNFIRKCILTAVIAVTAAIGLIAMPMLASAAQTTVQVNIEPWSTMSLTVTNPKNGYIVPCDGPTVLTVQGSNVDTIDVFLDSTSGAPIQTVTVGEEGNFTTTIEVVLPPGDNSMHTIILVGSSMTGEPDTRTAQVRVNFLCGEPVITSVYPPTGPTKGGTKITIKGKNFTKDAKVIIGGKECLNVVYVNSTTLTCKTPAHPTGNVSITVTTPKGGSYTMIDAFRYYTSGVLPPDTGLFRVGNKMVSLYEFIGFCVLVLVLIVAFIFLLIGRKKYNKNEKQSKKFAIKKSAKKAAPKKKKSTRRK